MVLTVHNGNKHHNIWLKNSEDNLIVLRYHESPKELKPGDWKVTSVEKVDHSDDGIALYSGQIGITNVGQETLVFQSGDGKRTKVKSEGSIDLKPDTHYEIDVIHKH